MLLTTLYDHPQHYKEAISLIESAFGYSEKNSFEVDFAPLVNKSNWKNCYILLEDNKVIAHAGVLERSLLQLPIRVIGGVVVNKADRGKGLSKLLLEHILKRSDQYIFSILWSDKVDFYKKFSFYPAIQQCEDIAQVKDHYYQKAHFNLLSYQQQEQIIQLYNSSKELRVDRSSDDWRNLLKITSTQLYIKQSNEVIENYCFIGKGEDLNNIIIEYGIYDPSLCALGILWSPYLTKTSQLQYACLMRVESLFSQFVEQFSAQQIKVKHFTKDLVSFEANNKQVNIEMSDFLTGVLGPNQFQEFDSLPPLYISGLDSI